MHLISLIKISLVHREMHYLFWEGYLKENKEKEIEKNEWFLRYYKQKRFLIKVNVEVKAHCLKFEGEEEGLVVETTY